MNKWKFILFKFSIVNFFIYVMLINELSYNLFLYFT